MSLGKGLLHQVLLELFHREDRAARAGDLDPEARATLEIVADHETGARAVKLTQGNVF